MKQITLDLTDSLFNYLFPKGEEYISGVHFTNKKYGVWQYAGHSTNCNHFKCSECGRKVVLYNKHKILDDYPFCHCGADMRPKGE